VGKVSTRRGKANVNDRQRAQIAAGKVAGKTHQAIAAATGLAVSTVNHHVSSDAQIATLTLRLKHKYESDLERGYGLAVKSILRHLKGSNAELQIDGRRDLMRLLVLGDPPLLRMAPTDNSAGMFTLEELLSSYRSAQLRGEV
jgi:hypothetical protein